MNDSRLIYSTFSEADIQAFRPSIKIGLLATINDDNLPHLTLIASLQASTPSQLIWGQFTEGMSKKFIKNNPHAAFLIMNLDKELWRGKAKFSHTATQGPEFDMYNNTPMFRYNAYFGVHTVYYMDLVEHSGQEILPMGQVVLAAVKTMIARTLSREPVQATALNPWTQQLLNKVDNLKFLAYVGHDGYPVIVPVIQTQAADCEHLIFSLSAYGRELEAIPEGAPVALFAMSLDMEDVLIRGPFLGIQRRAGIACGRIRVEWVYNPMPPKSQQIYPELPVEPVTVF